MEIEFWLQIGEISHTEGQEDGARPHALDRKRGPSARISLSVQLVVGTYVGPLKLQFERARNVNTESNKRGKCGSIADIISKYFTTFVIKT
jgi:hypothetical protein